MGRVEHLKISCGRPLLVVMAKEPRMGRVKTRLGRDVGAVQATAFYRFTMGNVLRRLRCDPRFETVLAVAPDAAVGSPQWPAHIPRVGQGPGDLGARMGRIMDWDVRGPIIIVGTDIPGLRAGHIADAFRLLGRYDAVFGSAGDGGYWLVGLRRTPRVLNIFEGVRWSGPHALGDTIANLKGRSVGFAATLTDVDDGVDFGALGAAGARVV